MSLKENSEIASTRRGHALAKTAMIVCICCLFAIPFLALVAVLSVGPSSSSLAGLLIIFGLLIFLTTAVFLVFFIVMASRPGVQVVILRNRQYIGRLEKSGLYLRSQVMNSAIAYESKVLDEGDSKNTYRVSAMLIGQGPGSAAKTKRVSPAWLLYDILIENLKSADVHRRRWNTPPPYLAYTAVEMRLNRPVPRLIFDSRKARGKQYARLYAPFQKLEVDAAAGDVFTAYSPEGYEIETLSFITPEVTLAMLEMAECDIEFIGDSLLCYGRLLKSDELEAFKAKCLRLHSKVNDNLLPVRRKKVTIDPWGYHLLENPKFTCRPFSVPSLSAWYRLPLFWPATGPGPFISFSALSGWPWPWQRQPTKDATTAASASICDGVGSEALLLR